MPGWAKALIIIVILGVLLIVGLVGAGVYWWSNNKDALIARGKAQIEEGRAAGRATDNQGCVDQSVVRYKAEPGFTNGIATSVFLQSCLHDSSPTPGFCDDVPKETEFIKSAQWRVAECERVDLSSDQYCQQLFKSVQRFCERRAVKSSQSTNADAP